MILFLNIMLVWKQFCDLGSNCGLSLGLKIKGTCFSNFGSNHGLAHFTPFDLNVVYSWWPTLHCSQVFPEFSNKRLEIVLASERPSVTIQKLAVTHLKKYRAKSTDPQKSMEIAPYSQITHSYTRCYETKITTESLLEEESKPALMLSTQNILVPAELVDPTLYPKRNMLILTTCGIKSISLENDILDVDWFRCRFRFSFIFSFTLESFFSLFWTILQDQKHAWKCFFCLFLH